MKTQVFFLSCMLLVTPPIFARKTTDIVEMKNGDRMTCEVKSLEGGVLTVSLDYVDGTIAVDWSKVARLDSNQLFVVLTQDGRSHQGTLVTSEKADSQPMKVTVTDTVGNSEKLDRSEIVRMTQTSERFHQRFNGGINLGVIYSKGNTTTQYNLGTEAQYLRERWAAEADFSSNLSSSSGSTTSTRNQLTLNGYHFLPWNNYFYGGLGSFLRSSVQDINLQTTFGAGIGHFFKNTNRASIAVLGGLAWQSTDYKLSTIPQDRQHIAAGLIVAQIKLFKFSRTNLTATARLLPAFSDPGRVRLNSNATYYLKLFNNLSWNISFYDDWDNKPPEGSSGSDYGTSVGVSWTFGNR